jgi:hypothetical protein
MDVQDMIDELDLYGFDDIDTNQKVLLLNEAYLDITTREPWPFLEKLITVTVPTGESKITNNASVSTNVTDLASVLSFVNTTDDIIMVPERTDVIEKSYRSFGTDPSLASKYYFVGEDLFVYPEVQGSTTFRLYYVQIPTDLTSTTVAANILLPSRHHSIIVFGALVKAFLVNDDPQSAVFQNMYESRYAQMRNDLWLNQYDRTERVHVISESSDWSY